MGPPGHGGSGGRWRQARCRGGNPGAHAPSATGGELRQSLLVLGLLRLGEHLPALAWGMARGAGERARGRGSGERSRWGRGREGQYGATDRGQGKGR